MTAKENLQLAAAIIAHSTPDLRTLIGLLEGAGGQKRLVAEIRRQMAKPTIGIDGQPHCDPALWARGSLR
jgi:hypothetical protein